jgi:hypothetical protein
MHGSRSKIFRKNLVRQRCAEDPELADICSKLQRGDKTDNYVLSKGTLYWCTRKLRGLRLVLPTDARAFRIYTIHRWVDSWG